MRAGIWNIRGYMAPGRHIQTREFIRREHLDFVGLQETIKDSFTQADLMSVDPQNKFAWFHSAAVGHSGGMLMGVNEDTFEVVQWSRGTFFIKADVR